MVETHPETRHEERDLSLKLVVSLAVGTLAFLLLVAFGTRLVIGYDPGQYEVIANLGSTRAKELDIERTFPEPRLQWSPKVDMAAYLARQKEQLTSYGWREKSQGIARIPISEAMDLLIARQARGNQDQKKGSAP